MSQSFSCNSTMDYAEYFSGMADNLGVLMVVPALEPYFPLVKLLSYWQGKLLSPSCPLPFLEPNFVNNNLHAPFLFYF